MKVSNRLPIVVFIIAFLVWSSAFAREQSDEELVKQLNNPVSISVPFQNNFECKLGPNTLCYYIALSNWRETLYNSSSDRIGQVMIRSNRSTNI